MEDNVNLMDKRVDDLTVKDTLKLQAGILAIMVAIPVAVAGASAAKDAVRRKLMDRQLKKSAENTEQ